MPLTRRFVLPLFAISVLSTSALIAADPPPPADPLDAAIPNDSLKLPFKDDAPIVFVARGANAAEWEKLTAFWNESTETVPNPLTGETVTRRVVKLKVPLGLASAPLVPASNPMTAAKWELGKRLYYDKTLSTNGRIACASCHDPAKGFTDQRKTSLGINEALGGINSPTVINSAYHALQFWDGRAQLLEDQAQGPVGNSSEMFGGKGEPWDEAILRLRAKPEYVQWFQKVFGHLPTRDSAAKAIAAYERTVLSGNSIYDRADVAMRKRVKEEETGKYDLTAADFAAVLKDAFTAKDANALTALGLDPAADGAKADEVGKKLLNGRTLFFNKARCTSCHTGDNFSDNQFHNLGVGAKDGVLPKTEVGRYASLPTGSKDHTLLGAFKTPGLRSLLATAPYLHSGEEKTLEAVVDFYDRGGNVNEFLDPKMRDASAEEAFLKGTGPPAPKPFLNRGGRPIIPLKLNLTVAEKADLVLFMKALQGDAIDPIVADPKKFPTAK